MSLGGWVTAVALGVLVRQPVAYLGVCTVALFALFALPGWIMFRELLLSPIYFVVFYFVSIQGSAAAINNQG